MLDAIVSQITTEIAIEGPQGVSRDKLWELVQEVATNVIKDNLNNSTIQPTIDDTYKRFLWTFIVKLPEIDYFEDTAESMDLDSQRIPTDSQPENAQGKTAQSAIAPEDQTSAAKTAKTTTKKRKAPKKPTATKKKPKKKPSARKKIAQDDDDDYSSDEFQPDDEEESEEESDFDVDDEDGQEDEDDEKTVAPKKTGSENPSAKNVDVSGYRPIKDIHMLSFDEIEQRYGSRLRLVANEELQNKQIYVGLPPGRPLSSNLQVVLGTIMRTRYNGLSQIGVTKELGLDPRSSGHYVKSLEQRGAIIRKPIVAEGCRTNLCIHIRYNHDESIMKKSAEAKESGRYSAHNVTVNGVIYSTKMLRQAVVALLTDAPDNIMYSYDILSALGFNPKDFFVKKWYYRSLESMCSKNVCRKLKPPREGVRTSRLLQLVDPNHASKENASSEYNPTVDKERQLKGCAGMLLTIKDVERPMRKGLMYDLHLEPQLLSALYEAGETGATQKDLQYVLRFSDSRSMYKCLERLSSFPKNPNATRFTTYRNFEFEGRIRRYRYYTYQAYIKLTEGRDVEPTDPPNIPIKEKELIEIDFRKYLLESKRRSTKTTNTSQKSKKEQKKPSVSTESRPVQKRPTRAATRANTTELEITSEATASQTGSNHTADSVASSMEKDLTDVNMTDLADTQNPKSVPAQTPNTLASIFLPRKRTRSQMSAIEENTNDSSQTSQTTYDTTNVTAASLEPSKRQRQTRSRKLVSKEADLSEQQLIAPEGPEEHVNVQESPVAEEEIATVASVASDQTTPGAEKPRRRNLFDYFAASSRQSPSPVPESRVRVADAQPTIPRNPGALYQQLVASSFEENTVISEGEQTDDAVPDEEIEELLAPDVKRETVSVKDSMIDAVDTGDATGLSNSNTITMPVTALASGNNGQRIRLNKKERREHITTTKGGIRSARHLHPTTDVNAYMVTRKKVLLELLQEHPILEHGKETMEKFLEKYRETYGDVKMIRNLDRKTFLRSAESLAKDGGVQIVTAESIGAMNKKSVRYVFVRNDLDVNGPEMKAFKENHRRSRALCNPRPRASSFDRFEKNVERITERLARMEDADNITTDNGSIETRRLLGNVRQLRSNVEKAVELCEQLTDNRGTGNWLMIAIQYGFIASKMIRVKLFHQYLLELLRRGGDGIDKEKHVIESATFVANMSLGLSLQVIGFYENNARLSDFVKDSKNLEIPLADLPKDIMELIMSEKNKFRRRLRTLLCYLLMLKLIEPTDLNGEPCAPLPIFDDSAIAYMLSRHVPIIDYWSHSRSIIREYTIDTATDAMIYWSELQCFCLTGSDKRPHPVPEALHEDRMIRGLATARNWNPAYVFTREQRKMLNAYVNKDTGETPFKKTSACKDIARTLRVPADMVINYFRHMERAFKRKLNKPLIRSLEYDGGKRRQIGRRKPARQLTWSAPSTSGPNVFKKTIRGTTARRLLRAQKGKHPDGAVEQNDKSRLLYLDDEATFPTIDENENISTLRLRRSTNRVKWTLEEDELLVYTYVILKSRALRSYRRFFWNKIEDILPTRSPQMCRSRFGKIKNLPKVAEHLTGLFSQWNRFYSEGIMSGDIVDKDIYDFIDFDLLGHLAYFIKRIQESDSGKKSEIKLPDSRETLESTYHIRTGAMEESHHVYYEDLFHSYPTLVQKYDVICDHYAGLRGYDLSILDHLPKNLVPEMNESERIIELLIVFIRMVLFTPDDMYDPFFAYGVLHQYPQELSKLAVDRMRALRHLVLAKYNQSETPVRRIPGHPYMVSGRYLNNMVAGMPEGFYLQASEFEKYLYSHGTTKFSGDLVSSGMMGCILNLISCDKLNYKMLYENLQWTKHRIPLNRVRCIDEHVASIPFAVEAHGLKEVAVKSESPKPQVQINELDEVSVESFWLGICSEQREEIQHVIKAIKCYLDDVKEAGADIIEIKENILAKYPGTSDLVIRECMEILCTTSPQLVYHVGFSTYRYILRSYISDWVVVPKNVRAPEPNDENIAARTKELATIRKPVIKPRIWIDVNGNTSSSVVLDGCMSAVLGRVLMRPGIHERDVIRLFGESLTYVEVKDILGELVNRGALRKMVTEHKSAPKVSLFSKRRCYSVVDPATINRNCQTSYWATSDFYKVRLDKWS